MRIEELIGRFNNLKQQYGKLEAKWNALNNYSGGKPLSFTFEIGLGQKKEIMDEPMEIMEFVEHSKKFFKNKMDSKAKQLHDMEEEIEEINVKLGNHPTRVTVAVYTKEQLEKSRQETK